MKVLIAGREESARRLAVAVSEATAVPATAAEPAGADSSPARLAARFRELERCFAVEQPDAVLLGDETDTALVALLVAAKQRVPVAGAPGAASQSPNGRLIAQLADEQLAERPGAVGDWARARGASPGEPRT